jgi:hypothetical protein
MSTVQQPPEPEQRERPPGLDPTRDVVRPPQGPPPLPPRYRPLAGRAAAITAMFGILFVIDLALIGAALLNHGVIDRLESGSVPERELDANAMRLSWLALASIAVSIACVVLFIRWLHLAYRNVDAISPPYRRFDTGWAIGSWFVPILNLVRPIQIVTDVWHSGLPERHRPPAWLAVWWLGLWGLWIYNRFLDGDPTGISIAEMREGTNELIIGSAAHAALIVLAICVVRSLTKRQEAKADWVAAKEPTPLRSAAPATTA